MLGRDLRSRIWNTPDAGNETSGILGRLGRMDKVDLRRAIEGHKQGRDDYFDLVFLQDLSQSFGVPVVYLKDLNSGLRLEF